MKMLRSFFAVALILVLISCDSNDNVVNSEVALDENSYENITTESTSMTNVTNSSENNIDNETEVQEETKEKESEAIEDKEQENGIDEEQEESSRDLNTKGYELYKNGEYEKALNYFKASIEKGEEYLYGHYNYACTLGVLMKLDYPEWYHFRHEIHSHLRKVIEIRPEYIDRIKKDKDLDIIRKDFEYFQLLGYGTKTDKDIQHLLIELNWYINGPGVITPIGGAGFLDDGTFSLSFQDLKMFSDGEFPIDTDHFTGTYEVKEGVIYFYLNEKMLQRRTYSDFFEREIYEEHMEFKGELDETGTLYIEIFDYPIHNWMDEFSA